MDNKIDLVLIGGGGHCKSCIEVVESTQKYNIIGILDLPSEIGKTVLGYNVIGTDLDYLKFKEKGYSFLITTGQIKTSSIRRRIYDKLNKINATLEVIIASTSTVSKYATIKQGSIIMHHCVVNAGVTIEENCIINTGAIIEHDVHIGSNSHISTNAVVNGDASIGDNTFIGSSSCISSGVSVTNDVIIGAGSTVIRDITLMGTYVGTPTQKI